MPSSTGDGKYLVSLPPWDRHENEIICSCPGYTFRGYCRHQRQALESLCAWNAKDFQTQQTPEQRSAFICPSCFGPTRLVMEDG